TIEALSNGTTADKATVAGLRQLLAAGAAELLPAPYVRLNLPAMLSSGLDGDVSLQLARGRTTLATDLGATPAAGVWAEQGPLSPVSVDALSARGVTRLVVNDADLASLPASLRNLPLAQPFELTGRTSRRVQAVAADSGLAAHLTPSADPTLAAHQLLADLA